MSDNQPKVRVFETFRQINDYTVNSLTESKPSCFNGEVKVKRYRVTIEEIEDSEDVIRERIQKLWDECKNHHHWTPLRAMARRYNLELKFP